MRFENWMSCEVVTSDGTYTIGHVDGDAAEWDGNMEELVEGMEFGIMSEGNGFGVNNPNEYIVENGKWVNP